MARPERIARPTRTDEWEVVAADKGTADDWERWAKQEPNALAAAYDQLAANPTQFSSRQKRLEGKTYRTGTHQGKTYDRSQYEATAGGRIFYFVDDPTGGGRRKPERRGDQPGAHRARSKLPGRNCSGTSSTQASPRSRCSTALEPLTVADDLRYTQ